MENLLLDFNDLLIAVKKASVDAVNASKPTSIVFGNVVSIAPLQIRIDQQMILGKAQLVLTRNVTDFTTNVTIDWVSENAEHEHSYTDNGSGMNTGVNIHNHTVMGVKAITVHNALVVGDKVVMVQIAGGQKFIVMDRVAA